MGRNDEGGYVLILSLVVLSILALTVSAAYLTATSATRSAQARLQGLQALYAAESGVQATLYLLNQGERPTVVDSSKVSENLQLGQGVAYAAELAKDGTVKVTGRVGKVKQNLQVKVWATAGQVFDNLLVIQEEIEVKSNAAKIEGPVRTESIEEGAINLRDSLEGVITIGAGGIPEKVVSGGGGNEIRVAPEKRTYPVVSRPGTVDRIYSDLVLSGGELELDTSSGDLIIYVQGDVDLKGQAQITVTGPNRVVIYVGGDIKSVGRGVTKGETDQFILIGLGETGSKSIKFAGSSKGNSDFKFNGIIYAPDYSIDVSGNGSINGALVGNSLTVTGSADLYYPEEKLADFNLFTVVDIPADLAPYTVQAGSWRKLD